MSSHKNDLLIKSLVEFGFSDKEAKTYITLLGLEIATANEIAKSSKLNRSSTYVVLDSLRNKGFVGVSNDKNILRYVAVSPDVILETLDTNIKKQNILKDKIKNIIPDLKGLDKSTKKNPIVRVFEGEAGMKELHSYDLNEHFEDLRIYENPEGWMKFFPEYIEKDAEARSQKNITMYNICPNINESENIFQNYSKFNLKDQYIFLPKKFFDANIDLSIWANKVTFSSAPSAKEKFGVVIESEYISSMLKNLFDLAWEGAKKIGAHRKIIPTKPNRTL